MGVARRKLLSLLTLGAAALGVLSPAGASADTVTLTGGAVSQADVGSFAVPYPSNVGFSGLVGPVTDVDATLTGFNTNGASSNLDWLLVGPAGQHVIIVSDVGGANTANNVTLTLDDAAASFLPTASALTSGTFKPTPGADGPGDPFNDPAPNFNHGQFLSDFNGTNPNGTWSLYATDDFFMQSTSATISSWSVTVTTDSTGPAITGAAAVPPKFAVNSAGVVETPLAAIAKKKKKKKSVKGTTINYTLNEAGTVTFKVEGTPACKKKAKKAAPAKKKKKCSTAILPFGSFKAAGQVGANSKPFSGVIGNARLGPGSYQMTLTATDAGGNVGAPAVVPFKIVK
jgi:hypothetical protein